ncbi:hypothetical protein OJF2_31280 [Aquisphaera giovannonii]|uniref:Uncharacterized protein n=1 Tax=Aquisphaera giovannonii TaxID=406548 RepID=A0A5B9W2W2_9BACT|nr:hypothetical protein [Aquisphaera giovannonii]QEH34587.1 hypothetical protein OJF2_31280 [Aquisphaera giovannonii]
MHRLRSTLAALILSGAIAPPGSTPASGQTVTPAAPPLPAPAGAASAIAPAQAVPAPTPPVAGGAHPAARPASNQAESSSTGAKASPELPDAVFAMTAQEKSQADNEAQQRKQQRMQKIQQAAFDRRPSAILKAWATPPEVMLDEGSRPGDNAQPGAVPQPVRVLRRRVVQAMPGMPPQPAVATVPEPQAPKGDPFDRGLRAFQLDVTLGNWPAVKGFLAGMHKDEGKALYAQLLQSLASGQAGMPGMMQPQQVMMNGQMVMMQPQQIAMEKNVFSSRDILGLAAAAPGGLEKGQLDQLGQVLRQSLDQGNAIEEFLARVRDELKRLAAGAALSERQAAKLLFAANAPVEAGTFLPPPEKAVKDDDREALNLLARHYLALHERDKKAAQLEQAWRVTQEALATGKVDRDQKDEAVRRAVELAPKIQEDLGRAWIEQSFTGRPDRGMEILAAIGAATSQGLQGHAFDTDFRTKSLELQKLAVEALLRVAPERAKAWKRTLGLLAEGWLREAEFSQKFDFSTSLGPRMQYDSFGNMYYSNYDMTPEQMMARQGNMPRALLTGDVIKNRPGDAWLAAVDEGMRPRFSTTLAQLYIKVNEEDRAFPYIEALAATHPRQAKDLAQDFLKTWTRNHDPNSGQMQRSRFFYVYGFESRAEGIPLTRSKQERNLVELASWVKKLKALPIGEIDEKLLTGAFTACHSPAEVYRLDAINTVFGSFDALKPRTLAELIQQMRGNLIGVWRRPDEQEKQKTKRREKDIRGEILRGYEVARAVVDQGLKKYPDHWALVLARASILHDENNYRAGLEKSTDFAPRRQQAFAEFRRAADLYAAAAPGLPQDEQTTEPYEMWFSASLGACDLQHITDETLPDDRQPALIRKALESLKGEDRERHLGRFANALFTHLNVVKPSAKVRYLKGGFEIVGDHPQAHDARKVYDYYKDLVTEIKLEAKIDGPDAVGHGKPFGVFVNIRHTKEIERESGGFGRYLQNQNSGNYSYYNFGRPLENYRDKFAEMAKQALQEQFEIVSVTFQDEKVNSRSSADYGWRYTPYAYLLLKARGPKVDRIAPLRLDFDFMDTSGYVILPVESPAIPVDAGGDGAGTRPHEKLAVTQILDERQAKDGTLILEVRATARGLVPDLDEIVDLKPEGFELEKVDDQGLSVSKFDPDAEANVIDSERTWLVHFRGAPVGDEPAKTFRFAAAREDGAEMIHQRYVDADLAKVGTEVVLEAKYGEPARAWLPWLVGGLTLGALAIGAIVALARSRPRHVAASRFRVPEEITPFSVLGLLREIEHGNGLPAPQLQELNGSIRALERHYFAGANGREAEPDLRTIAETWVRRAS